MPNTNEHNCWSVEKKVITGKPKRDRNKNKKAKQTRKRNR